MKQTIVTFAFAALTAALPAAPAAHAQAAETRTPQRPAADSVIPLERIVAVVGDKPILWNEVLARVNERRAEQQLQIPKDSAEQMAIAKQMLQEMIDEEVLVQRAASDTAVKVSETEVLNQVEQQIKKVRANFRSDLEFATKLKDAGFGTPEEYRRWLTEQSRRNMTQSKLIQRLREQGKIVPVPISEEQVTKAFEETKGTLPKRPATVTFRQIIVAARPSDKAKAAARAKAEAILAEIKKGGDFEQIAKRESMDAQSKDVGGDIGWTRRGGLLAEFENALFSLPPGVVSPIVETSQGFHIIRVDRVQPGERKARQILIRPPVDSSDIAGAKLRADSALALWKKGTPFDTLVARYHDADEVKSILEPFDRTQLPASYQQAFAGKKSGEYVEPFAIDDPQRAAKKYVAAHIETAAEGGEYTVADLRSKIRDELSQEHAMRRLIDGLRKQTFVSVKL
jgi:peptidyl-prolyl cis-trans isomerase SurA